MTEIKRILQQITALSDVPDVSVLKRLIDELRVTEKNPALANRKIQSLIDFFCNFLLINFVQVRFTFWYNDDIWTVAAAFNIS